MPTDYQQCKSFQSARSLVGDAHPTIAARQQESRPRGSHSGCCDQHADGFRLFVLRGVTDHDVGNRRQTWFDQALGSNERLFAGRIAVRVGAWNHRVGTRRAGFHHHCGCAAR